MNAHISERIDLLGSVEDVGQNIRRWFEQYDAIDKLVGRFKAARLPAFVQGELKEYLGRK
ncbi:MAG: hypothetical protein LBP79_07515 [Clostridiales bacterium]|nr:hypothetical protein [Clostridiales bacterium]